MNDPNSSTTAVPQRRYRSDGWTPEVQRDFIEHLALTGSVRAAAKAVGRSPVTAYRLRARPDADAFRAAWAAATAMAYHALHELAMDRITNGIDVPVLDADGCCIYLKTAYNDRLLMFMLNHLRPDHPPIEPGASVERVANGSPALLARALAELDAAPMDVYPGVEVIDPREDDPAATAALDAMFDAMHAELDAARGAPGDAYDEDWFAGAPSYDNV